MVYSFADLSAYSFPDTPPPEFLEFGFPTLMGALKGYKMKIKMKIKDKTVTRSFHSTYYIVYYHYYKRVWACYYL